MDDGSDTRDIADEWQDIGLVIDACNRIETKMKKIIASYLGVSENRAAFLESVLLNNSIVSFASKVKLILAIGGQCDFVELSRNDFHDLLRIRNAYAHSDLIRSIRQIQPDFSALIDLEPDPDFDISDQIYHYHIVESIKGDGTLEAISRADAFTRFYHLQERVNSALDELVDKLVTANS